MQYISRSVDPSITADVLNHHYAAMSRDDDYESPLQKQLEMRGKA